MGHSPAATHAEASSVIPLRYVARAGLLPELTRQTYDSLYKALREVILNSVDAGASEVVVDLSTIETDGTVTISDDGCGMTLDELQHSFMSLGGSQKFASEEKFGRIGIGSLALMHYAQRVELETKRTGTRMITKAVIAHPWALDQRQRAQDLDDFRAGHAWEEHFPTAAEHFTVIRLHGVEQVLLVHPDHRLMLDRSRRPVVPEAVDAASLRLRRQEHPLRLGTDEVVDVHQHRGTNRRAYASHAKHDARRVPKCAGVSPERWLTCVG